MVSGDIVERLRPALVRYCRTSEECMGTCKNACAWHKELLTYENVAAAADEIERLRAEVERKHDYACRMDALAEERLMEITRLRRWQEEAAIALDAATVIGQRHGTPLHWANHDRLIREARRER